MELPKLDLLHVGGVMNHIVIIGKRATGKSTLVKHLIQHRYADIPTGVIVGDPNPYTCLFPNMKLIEHYEPNVVGDFLKQQKITILKRQDGDTTIDPHAHIVFDACFMHSDWSSNKAMRMLLMNSRQFYSNVIIALQYAQNYHNSWCADYVFIFKESYEPDRLRLFELYGGFFPDYKTFVATLDKYTEDHSCLVIRVNGYSKDNNLFWYKA